jgi:putative DNA primase/helicase
MDTFTETKYQSHPTELAGLQGARLVTATETQEGRRWNEERVKALTGSDRIAARFMRADYFEYVPAFKLVIAGNHKPSLRTVDEAMRRRIQMLPFTITIPETERDPQLTERLRKEWPGILQWAIEGCLEWQRTGLSVPEVVREAGSNYLQAEDTVQAWIDDCCESRTGAWSASAILYASWQRYAEASGEVACSQKRFAAWLEAKGFHPHRTTGARGFNGIRLRDDA